MLLIIGAQIKRTREQKKSLPNVLLLRSLSGAIDDPSTKMPTKALVLNVQYLLRSN